MSGQGEGPIALTAMTPADYDAVYALWARTPGVYLGASDTREAIGRYLARNPGLSLVARDGEGGVIGAILCGHDGRRGLLHHLAVDPAVRRQGVGRRLVERCLASLRAEGIAAALLFILHDNLEGRQFWESLGWSAHADAETMWYRIEEPPR